MASQPGLRAGQATPSLQRMVTPFVMYSRQWAGTNPVHWDVTLAGRQGMRAPVATGQFSAALIQESCVGLLGEAMFRDSVIDVRFRRPVYVNDVLTVSGQVVAVTAGDAGQRVVIEAACRNQDGVEVTVARVEATMRG